MNNSNEDVTATTNSNVMCRMTKIDGELTRPEFEYYSGLQCYRYLGSVIDGFESRLKSEDGLLYYEVNSSSPLVKFDPSQVDLFEQTMSPFEFDKWRECSQQAMRCCDDVMALESIDTDGTKCPSIWDGWSCHMTTRSGEYSIVKCPEHHVADTCHTILGYINFKCESNGTWFKNSLGVEWANYTQCLQPYYEFKEQIIDLNIVSHFISLIFLLTGLIIFYSYRKLDVNRITFHKQFFISLILHSIMQIIWEFKFMRESLKNYDTYINSNHHACIVANLLLNYARSTNYFWMFNESFYLFKLLIRVFDNSSNLAIYYVIGWGFPFLICTAYAIVSYSYSNYGCWTQNLKLNLIIIIPNVAIILLNLLFMIFILKLLYRTLNTPNKNEINQYKRTFKATLILVPMFGLHYFLSPIVLCDSEFYSRVYNIFSRLLENLQGVMVALLYCFFNKEVQLLVKKSWRAKKFFEFLSLDEFRHGLAPTSTELSHLDTLTGTGVQIKR